MSETKTKIVVCSAALGATAIVGILYRQLRRRIKELEAREQMREYAALYTRGIDRLDPVLVRAPFTHDAIMDIPNIDKDLPIAEFSVGATNFLGKSLVSSLHNITNSHIIFDKSMKTAKSETYFIANHFKIIDGSVVNAAVYGRYCDIWVQTNDGIFKIIRRKILYDFQGSDWNKTVKEAQSNEEIKQKPIEARASNLGSRDKNDFSYSFIFPEFASST
mmetsp:Transcript_14930/g.19776  ORF Transcript_14930/g.19776 Transcript_14930/m.19776 type:complete len:219 (+) Transcript_14930:155-811(+)|eukprot:CAMPEP_0197291968 /NCGR_PEP_ID=MMETSP0890-20130614/20517_1 /TAXON_ID=44058 ORGANISM="Aureoumbra lagunensis, Strain CCMP1510" /NCGR_SAMPLE_ID=MMETSP0890 /ASSEMBLY_ACC=CAM_ASM_000533 /LENGTH=218 /DNA_ID=CAMNT_0042765493 /DNA_START=151 /DNA_END=807 /DNA_ORIENTATION=-